MIIPKIEQSFNQNDVGNQTIHAGFSTAFCNKENLSGSKSAFGNSFIPSVVTLEQFVQHVTNGGAWTPGYFNGRSRRKDTFVSADTIGLDFDENVSIDDILNHPFSQKHGVMLVHSSASDSPEWHKSRAVFRLEKPITDYAIYETLAKALQHIFSDLQPDPATKDAARLWFGSDKPGYHVDYEALLPSEVVEESLQTYSDHIDAELEKTRQDAPGAMIPLTGSTAERAAAGYLNAVIDSLASTTNDRHNATLNASFSLYGCLRGDWPGISEDLIRWEILTASARNGYIAKVGEDEITRLMNYAADNASPKPLEMPSEYKTFSVKDIDRPTFDGDVTVNQRYISEYPVNNLLEKSGVLIRSAIGTGKTELISRIIPALENKLGRSIKVLVLTHRQSLAKNTADRLGFENYSGYAKETAKYLRQIPKLVISFNSVWKLAANGQQLPKYDLLIIDECEQYFDHLNSNTFTGNEAKRAYMVLRQLMKETPRKFFFDAHMTDITRQFVSSFTEDMLTIVNTFQRDRGQLTIYEYQDALTQKALDLISQDAGVVAVPCASKATAKAMKELIASRHPEKKIMLISSDNSMNTTVQDFIASINDQLADIDVLIYSPSLGTGIDITAPVYAVCGFFDGNHLTASDLHQMIGRCRNVNQTHVYVQPVHSKAQTDWQEIYIRHYQNAEETAAAVGFSSNGDFEAVSEIHKSMLKLTSMCEAAKNRIFSDQLSHFIGMAKDANFTVETNKDEADLSAAMKAARDTVKAHDKAETLAAEAVDHETYRMHQTNGTMNDEIRYGHDKHIMENTVGLKLTEHNHDDLNTSNKRQAIRNFTDLLDTDENMQAEDRSEIEAEILVNKRRHRRTRRSLRRQAIKDTFGSFESEAQLTEADINEGLENFISLHESAIHRHFAKNGRRLSMNPVAILRRILSSVGIRLRSKQVMVNGERFMAYWLDRETVNRQNFYARARLAHLAEKRAESAISPTNPAITKNVYIAIAPNTASPPIPPDKPPKVGFEYLPKLSADRVSAGNLNPFGGHHA